MRPDVLATTDEFFKFARIPKEEQTDELVEASRDSIQRWTLLRFGPGWCDELPAQGAGAAACEIMALVEMELFEPSEHRRKILEEVIKHAEWWSRTTYQTVRHFLRHKLTPMGAVESLAGTIVRAAKGEFKHYDQVKDRLQAVRMAGADVAVLKGTDPSLEDIAADLQTRSIPCRAWTPARPAIRYYLVDGSFLFLFSHGNGAFTIFGGERPAGFAAIATLWDHDWQAARSVNTVSGGLIAAGGP